MSRIGPWSVRSVPRRVASRLGPRARRLLGAAVPAKLVQAYDHRIADAYVVSFPKCGRTWLRLMLGKAIDDHFGLGADDLMELTRMADRCPALPRIVFSHDDNAQFKAPDRIETSKERFRGKKVVFLVRDPRDVAVSLYFQLSKRRDKYSGTISDFLRRERGGFESLITYYNVWERERARVGDILLVRYEDLHADAAGELRRVVDFLGLGEITDAEVAEAVRFASFDNMRAMEQQDTFGSSRLRPADAGDEESFKTRKGAVGGYREYLTGADLAYVDAKMSGLGSWLGYAAGSDGMTAVR